MIPDRFSLASNFSEGLAAVAERQELGEMIGFIDATGTYLIPPQFRGADVRFSEGLAAVWQEDGGFGYVDRSGQIVIPYQYYFAAHFSSGLAQVGMQRKAQTWYGFVNREGEVVIDPRFTSAAAFEGGLAWVSTGEESGYINLKGEFVWIDS